jgi:inner membrane transporter RhtA
VKIVPPWTLGVAAILSVQLGSALSVGLIDAIGAGGTAWLRLSMGAVIFLIIARPPLRSIQRRDVAPLIGLGLTTGLTTVSFLSAIERIPLGTAVAIEFLGPLSIAALRSRDRRALLWPAMALVGVVLLGEPWRGEIDLGGVGFAVLAACGWACYIILTQRIGDRFTGVSALSITVPIAAIGVGVIGIPQSIGHLTWSMLPVALGLAVLLPVLPFALEMLALRRMTTAAFGILMALEPAMGVLLGLVLLHQSPSLTQVAGLALVVTAGVAAQRGGHRHQQAETAHPELVS